ncbi:MAG: DUF2231 domain-containing protein [Deltaproteobacteria bacterium]|nr:DUF2231 domain-containing protein [Deltaproteobacteria bacterium]
MNDIRGRRLRLLDHPLHPPLTHFPISLLSVSLLWDVIGLWKADPFWSRMALWCIIAGLAIAVPAVITGISEYIHIPDSHRGLKTATLHMAVMFGALSSYAISMVLRFTAPASPAHSNLVPLVFSGLGLVLISAGGWLGGELVFSYGIGVDKKSDPGV